MDPAVRSAPASDQLACFQDLAAQVLEEDQRLSPTQQSDGESSVVKAQRIASTVQSQGSHRFEWLHQRCGGTVFPCEVAATTVRLSGRPATLES